MRRTDTLELKFTLYLSPTLAPQIHLWQAFDCRVASSLFRATPSHPGPMNLEDFPFVTVCMCIGGKPTEKFQRTELTRL